MKILPKYIVSFLLFLICKDIISQSTYTIDISTGRDNNNILNYQNLGAVDDTWKVGKSPTPMPVSGMNAATPNTFNNAFVSNGDMVGNPAFYPSQNPNIRWMAVAVNASGQTIATPPGVYFYKMTFKFPYCDKLSPPCVLRQLKSVTIHLNKFLVQAANNWGGFWLNGTQISGTYNTNSPISISVPVNQINLSPPTQVYMYPQTNGGMNTLYLSLTQNGGGLQGTPLLGTNEVAIDGYLEFNYYDDLTDRDGIEKTEFCIGEDVFFSSKGLQSNSYDADLIAADGITNLASVQNLPGSPNWLNLSTLFNNFSFQPGINYTFRLKAHTPCGVEDYKRVFKYSCCTKSTDPSFILSSNKGNAITAQAVDAAGNHEWKVYSSQNVNTGVYTPIWTNDVWLNSGPSFSKNTPAVPLSNQTCYYVTHTIHSICGVDCTSQSICDVSCEDSECEVSAPDHLDYNASTKQINWSPVNGSVSYVVEITKNGCCGSNDLSVNDITTIQVPVGTSVDFDLSGPGESAGMPARCYLIKVCSVCKNGTRSFPSTKCVFP